MSTTTNEQYSTTPGSPNPNKNNTWIYLAVIAVLLGVCIYLVIDRNNKVADKDTITKQYESLTVDKTEIEGEYKAALARLDDLVSKNTSLNSEINDRDGEISKMKKEIQNIMSNKNATEAELRKAKRLIDELNNRTKGYEERIAQLEGENRSLAESNVSLSQQKDSISTEAGNIKKIASVLHASNIRMMPIDLRKGGRKEVTTGKARKTDMIRILFDIDENRIAESGQKELFLRITGPDGKLFTNSSYGSGVTTDADGASLQYTMSKFVALNTGEPVRDVAIDWKQQDYDNGSYYIELFHMGYKIGSGTVRLK